MVQGVVLEKIEDEVVDQSDMIAGQEKHCKQTVTADLFTHGEITQ